MNKIQWNSVTWYSKLFALALFVALPFIGFYYGMQYGKLIDAENSQPVSPAASVGTVLPAYYATPSEWQTDANNTRGGFSIAYPIDFDAQDNYSAAPSTDWSVNADNIPGVKYFTLIVPKAYEPQTNLGEVTFTIGASGNDVAVSQCVSQTQNTTSSVTINGISFIVFRSSDAGAGNLYDTTSYRTLHAGKCYAIEYTIHSGQIANYPSSYNLKPFDEAKIATLMQNIIGTFKFL